MAVKEMVARHLVQIIHGRDLAAEAAALHEQRFKKKDYTSLLEGMESIQLDEGAVRTLAALTEKSNSEIRRLVSSGAVKWVGSDNETATLSDPDELNAPPDDAVGILVTKKHLFRLGEE